MTGALQKIDIQGRNGEKLRDHWEAGYVPNRSARMAPNLFNITGPGSPSVLPHAGVHRTACRLDQ